MALFKTRSAAVYGIDAHLIDVEVDMYSSGSARDFVMVGMPDTRRPRKPRAHQIRPDQFRLRLSQQSRHHQSGARQRAQGRRRLRPADGARHSGRHGHGRAGSTGTSWSGELSLDGAIRPVRGALSIAVCARDQGIPNLILPAENAAEAAVVEGVDGLRHAAPGRGGGPAGPSRRVHAGIGQRPPPRCRSPAGAGFPRRPRPDHRQARARGGRRRARTTC